MYGPGYPGMPPPQMHRALQAMEAAGGAPQEYTGTQCIEFSCIRATMLITSTISFQVHIKIYHLATIIHLLAQHLSDARTQRHSEHSNNSTMQTKSQRQHTIDMPNIKLILLQCRPQQLQPPPMTNVEVVALVVLEVLEVVAMHIHQPEAAVNSVD